MKRRHIISADIIDRKITRRRNPRATSVDAEAMQAAYSHGHNFGVLAAHGTLPPESMDLAEYRHDIIADLPFRAKRTYIFVAFMQAILPRPDRKALWDSYWKGVNAGIEDGMRKQLHNLRQGRGVIARLFGR